METLLIVLSIAVIFSPTVFFGLNTDDVRWYNRIQNGMFNHKITGFMSFISSIRERLYGGGTLAFTRKCPKCKGEGTLKIAELTKKGVVYTDNKTQCDACNGKKLIPYADLPLDHSLTVLIHSTICVLIYFAFGKNNVSLFAALLYAFHPANTNTSIWLNGRRYAIVTILVLIGMMSGKLAFIPYLITPIFHLTGLFVPLAYGYWQTPLIIIVALFGYKFFIKEFRSRMSVALSDDFKMFTPKRLIIVVKTFGFYFSRMFYPGRTFIQYPFLRFWGLTHEGNKDAYSLSGGYFYSGLFGIMALLSSYIVLPDPYNRYCLFILIGTLQWCNFVCSQQTVADRYISVVNVFSMFMLSWVAWQFGQNFALIFLSLYIGYFISQLINTYPMYRNIFTMWDYHNFFDPANVIARKIKANNLIKKQEVPSAFELIREGLKINPYAFDLLYQAAVCMSMMGNIPASNAFIKEARKHPYLGQETQWEDALKAIEQANSPKQHTHAKENERRMKKNK